MKTGNARAVWLAAAALVLAVIVGGPQVGAPSLADAGVRSPLRQANPSPPPRLLPGQHPYASGIRLELADGRSSFVQVDYLLYAPAGVGNRHNWPLVVFLHGYGERGSNPWLLTAQPLPKTLAHTSSFPALVLSPQLPNRFSDWSQMIEPIDKLVQRLVARYPIDRRRIYLTGLSTGGYGSWIYAVRHPQRFAALAPIAGGYPGGVPTNICVLRMTPVWAFHGGADTIIPPDNSQILVDALRRCGSKVARLTVYAGIDHFHSWPRAYADPALWRWMFAQHRS